MEASEALNRPLPTEVEAVNVAKKWVATCPTEGIDAFLEKRSPKWTGRWLNARRGVLPRDSAGSRRILVGLFPGSATTFIAIFRMLFGAASSQRICEGVFAAGRREAHRMVVRWRDAWCASNRGLDTY